MRRSAVAWIALVALAVAVGVVYALLGALGMAGPGADGFDPGGAVRSLVRPHVWEGVAWSLWIATASTALSSALALFLALAIRGGRAGGRWLRTLVLLPLPVPHLVAAVCGVLVLGQSGLLGRAALHAGWVSTPAEVPALIWDPWGVGLIVSLVWKEVPFLFLVAAAVLTTRGEAAEAEARRLGASSVQVALWVTLPLVWRGMLPGVIAVFAFVLGSWEAATLLGPSDPLALPLQIWEAYTDAALERRAHAYVLTLVGLALALVAVAVHDGVDAPPPPGAHSGRVGP